jgi:lysyl-tRNA synthetase class 2
MGIDRIVMFLSNNSYVYPFLEFRAPTNGHRSIKEVLTFPFMKDIVEEKAKTAAEVVGIEPKPEEGIHHK